MMMVILMMMVVDNHLTGWKGRAKQGRKSGVEMGGSSREPELIVIT